MFTKLKERGGEPAAGVADKSTPELIHNLKT